MGQKIELEKRTFEATDTIKDRLPFPINIGSDNDSAFINYQCLRYWEKNHITFTRSRAGNKNDGYDKNRRAVDLLQLEKESKTTELIPVY